MKLRVLRYNQIRSRAARQVGAFAAALAVLTVLLWVSPTPVATPTVGPGPQVAQAATPKLSDIKYHWAKDPILSLVEDAVVEGYPDGTFKPERNVTRAEFSKIVARAFALRSNADVPFKDVKNSWAKQYVAALYEKGIVSGYPNGTFGPDRNISHAEMAAMLARVAGFGEKTQVNPSWQASFIDVPAGHWAFPFIEMAQRLDIVPAHFGAAFQPAKSSTRAETAFMVDGARNLAVTQGKVSSVSASNNTVTLRKDNGSLQTLDLEGATVLRNNVPSQASALLVGDRLAVVSPAYGNPRLVKASGAVTRNDVLSKLSGLTGGALTPEQIDSIAKGNYSAVQGDLQPALYQRLLEYGLTPDEATSILTKDWRALQGLAKDRLITAISEEIGVSRELAGALVAGDWDAAKGYAGVEVAQYLLGGLLGM